MKTGNLKKAMTLALAVIMAMSLCACSGGETPGGSNSPSNSSGGTGQNSQSPASTKPGVSTTPLPEVVPLYDPPITLRVGAISPADADEGWQGSESMYDNTWVNLYRSYGINIEYIWEVAGSQADTKMSTAIASGDYPDVFTVSSSNYVNYANTGVIADITDLFEAKITDNGRAYLDSDAGAGLRTSFVNGRQYGLPTLSNPYDNIAVMFLRNDWLKKVGLGLPKTVDDVFNIAKAFTEQDPDGNGRADTYGLAINGREVFSYNSGLQFFFEMFGAAPGFWDTVYTFVKSETGDELVWGGMLPGMKQGLTMLQDMYKAGYIAQDFGAMDGALTVQELQANKAGIWFQPVWGCMGVQRIILQTDPDSDIDIVAVPLPGVDEKNPGRVFKPTAVQNYFCVSSKCETPEVLYDLFKLSVDKLMFPESPDEYDRYAGLNGVYTGWKLSLFCGLNPLKNVDNYQRMRPAVENRDPSGLLTQEQKTQYQQILDTLDWRGERSDTDYLAGLGLYKVFIDPLGSEAAVDVIINSDNRTNELMYTGGLTNNMIRNYATLDKLVKEQIIKIICGDPVSDYDKMIENWLRSGGELVTQEANDWYRNNK